MSGNILTVSANKLSSVTSGLITYIAYVTYTDPDTGIPINATADISFALVTTGANAKSAWISGEQVFKYSADGETVSPAQIVLTANLQNVSMNKWQYKDGSDEWQDYPTTNDNANITGTTLVIKPTHNVFVDDSATLRILTSDANIGDIMSVYKITDGGAGEAGEDASVAFLTNENVTFAANAEGSVAAGTSVTCNVVAYRGTTKVTPTVGTITGAPSGMTVTKGNAVSNEIPITISIPSASTLGSTGQRQGTLSVPITSPVNTTLTINWSKVCTGATGEDGEDGIDSIVFTIYAPNGTVFLNQEGTLNIETMAYEGAARIASGATYVWEKYASGTWSVITGETGSAIEVDGTDVTSMGSYRCTMTYKENTYQDVITLIDKTDNYALEVDSTAGEIFKNGIGETILVARLWQNGQEADGQKSATYSESAPASPANGAYYYKITKTSPSTALMRYNGTEWSDVTSSATLGHTKKYTWYRRDKDGNPLDGGAAFATGKVIFVDGDDVDNKTVFVCEVE